MLSLAVASAAENPFILDEDADVALTLAQSEQFELNAGASLSLPSGWNRSAFGDGFALRVSGAQAGLNSVAQTNGTFSDVVVQGQFAFEGSDGTAQLFARRSAAGAYVATLSAEGEVTLEKRGGDGIVLFTWRATAEPQAVPGAARTLELSAMGGALRVTVDGVDVLTAHDAEPLPPGDNKIGAVFTTNAGALTFDNYCVWIPAEVTTPKVLAQAMPATPLRNLSEDAPFQTMAADSPPANDAYANRLNVTVGRYANAANNALATTEASEPLPSAAADIANTVWYEFTPPATRSYLLTSFGTKFDSVLGVYTGTWGALTEVASSDNVAGSLQAQLTLNLDSAQTYYIQLGSRNGSGEFEFRIMDPAEVQVPSTPAISSSAPGAPFAPVADKGRTNAAQPVVAWAPRPAVTPFAYLTEVSTEASFSSLVASGLIEEPEHFWQIAPSLNSPILPTGQKYYWRVAALNFLGQTSTSSPAYSFTFDDQAPTPPALFKPTVNSVNPTLRPTLTWQAIPDAVSYRVIIASNFSATTPVNGNDLDVTKTSFTPAADLPQGEYWFAVRSRDAAGNLSEAGEKRRFLVNLSQAPANDGRIIVKSPATTADVVLTWTKIPGATYTLEVSGDSSFSLVDSFPNLTEATFTLTGKPIGTYYWRVSVNGTDLPMSLARIFTITPPVPDAPLIQTEGAIAGAVANGAFTNDTSPNFDWTVPANWATPPLGASIIYYELQIATDSKFTQDARNVVSQPYTSNFEWDSGMGDLPLTQGTIYYWRVRAVTNLIVAGPYSKTFTFTLDTENPAAPEILSPVQNSIPSSLRPQFQWKAVKGAVRYHARVATNFSGTTPVPDCDVYLNGTTFTPPFDLGLGQYWFFVETQDAAGNWSGWSPGQGRTFFSYLMQAPAKGENFVVKSPANTADVVLKWIKSPGVTYRVEIALDGDSSFTGNVLAQEIADGTYTAKNLSPAHCFWRVYPVGTTPPAGYYSTFSVLPSAATPPLIEGVLVEDDVISDQTPVFDWTQPVVYSGSLYSYRIQVATDAKFSKLVGEIDTFSNATQHEWPNALLPGTYYWRVRLVSPWGEINPYSKPYRFTIIEPSTAMPVLTAPAANTVFTTSRPTLKWKPVALSAGYRVRISTDAAGLHPVTAGNGVELTKTTFTPATDLAQGEYWFGVESKDPQGDWSGFGETRRFVVNYSLAPANEAFIVAKAAPYAANVVFKWAPIPNGNYRVQVATNPSFTNPTVSPPLTSPTYTLANKPVGTYYWRVLVNGQPQLASALAHRFAVSPPLPVAPVIQTAGARPGAVAKAGVTNDQTPIFDWSVPANWATPPAGGSLTYEVQVASDKKFTSLVGVEAGIINSDFDWPTVLSPGIYYWRVQAITNLGARSTFSPVYAFTVDLVPPSLAVLKSPADQATFTTPRPNFSWAAGSKDTRSYRFEIDDASDFATPVFTSTGTKTSLTLPQSLPQGRYYWRVFALDAAGNGSDSPTAARELVVDFRVSPSAGAAISAANAAGIPVAFKWIAPKGASTGTTYTIEIDANADGTPDITLPSVTTLTTTSTSLPPGYYQYRLSISNGLGISVWRPFVILPP